MTSDVCSRVGNLRDIYLKRTIIPFFVDGTYRGPIDYRKFTNRVSCLES